MKGTDAVMNNITKFKILKPANEVFEAFVDPSSSERWEQGKVITLEYDLFDAQLNIEIVEIEENRKIAFKWGANGEGHIVRILLNNLDHESTIIEVIEEGFKEDDVDQLLDNKEGWVFMLSCLKGYLEFGVDKLREGLVKD